MVDSNHPQQEEDNVAQVVIAGAGIVGLVLALALKKHCSITAEMYEQSKEFSAEIGAGMGMYPNGLRVIRDISPELLQQIRDDGYPYQHRTWTRHDGTEIIAAQEDVLCDRESELQSMGIRRGSLQRILYKEIMKEGIPIHFRKRIANIHTNRKDDLVEMEFEDGSRSQTQVLFGADGCKSKVRQVLFSESTDCRLQYTGVTCLMGMADLKQPRTGISLPSSHKSQCHGAFFATSKDEECFQFYFSIAEKDADPGNWGTLSNKVGKRECHKLATKLRTDGWNEVYLEPLANVKTAVRVGLCLLDTPLEKWIHDDNNENSDKGGRVVLVGDAAHPAVPYIGQAGAQMGLEDAGVVALLIKMLCLDKQKNKIDMSKFSMAMKIYEKMRIPHAAAILNNSKTMGKIQRDRSGGGSKHNKRHFRRVKEEMIQRQVFFHETLPILVPGAHYDYKQHVMDALQEESLLLPPMLKAEQ